MTAYGTRSAAELRALYDTYRDEDDDVRFAAFGRPPYYFMQTDTLSVPYHQFGQAQFRDDNGVE